jgi:hypothetical protein
MQMKSWMVISLNTSRTNKELTLEEFHVANNIKRAMVNLHRGEYNQVESFLSAALKGMYQINK